MTEPASPTMPEQALGILMRLFAHDLKGDLGTTGLWFYLLDSAQSEEDRARGVQGLKDTFAMLDRAATDLGDAGRSFLGGTELARESVDLAALVATALAAAERTAFTREITFAGALPPGPWPDVRGDHTGLSRTMERLFFWTVAHASNGTRLAFEVVIDDAFVRVRLPSLSLPEGEIPGLRERLLQVTTGTRESGLALPLAREMLRLHGGELERTAGGLLEARIPLA